MSESRNGAEGQVENDPYCMNDSWQSRNVKSMNEKMGYHNMSDLANSSTPPTQMKGATRNEQLSPKMPGDDRYDYNDNR